MGLDMGGQTDPLAYRQDGEFPAFLLPKLALSLPLESLYHPAITAYQYRLMDGSTLLIPHWGTTLLQR